VEEGGEEEIDLEPFRSTNSAAGFQGVRWYSRNAKYQAQFKVNGAYRQLGYFDTAEEAARAYARAYIRHHGGPPAPPTPRVAGQVREKEEGERAHGGPPAVALKMKEPKMPRKRQRNDCLPEEAPPPASSKRKTDPKKEEREKTRSNVANTGAANAKFQQSFVVPVPDKAVATKRARASSEEEDEEEEEEASSSRPAKRARTTTRYSGGMDIQVGEQLEVEWNGTYYPATVVAITLDGHLNVK